MRKRWSGGLVALALAFPLLGAGPGTGLKVQPESKLWVEGSSTVRGFSCAAQGFDATVTGAGLAGVLQGQKAVESVDVKVPAEQLDCGNGKMNEHMRKALKADEHPVIEFRLTSYELPRRPRGRCR